MGECGCGNTDLDKGFVLPNNTVVAYQTYPGCEGCFAGPGVSIHFFDSPNADWLDGVPLEKITPDEFGGAPNCGVNIGLFETCDLVAASRELRKEADVARDEDDEDGYDNLSDWLRDYGVQLIREAMTRFHMRMAKEQKERAERAAKRGVRHD